MRLIVHLSMLVMLLSLTTGCLKLSLLVSLNADGSGTITFTHLITNTSLEDAVALANKEGVPTSLEQAKEKVFSAFTDDIMLKESARQYGKATFSKVEKVRTPTHMGVTVTYTFKDINEIKVNSIAPLGSGWQGGVNYGASFSFSPDTRTLLITTNDADATQNQEIGDAEVEMLLKQLDECSGTSVSMDIQMPTPILQTDAGLVDHTNNRISLFNIDLDTLKQNRSDLKQAMKANNTLEGVLKLKLKGIHAEKQGSSLSASF